jgi:hypothetical protein
MEVGVQFHAPVALPPAKEPPMPVGNRGLGGPQCRSGRGSGKENFLPLLGIEPRPACNLVSILTELHFIKIYNFYLRHFSIR